MRRHQRENVKSAFVFVSERGAPLSAPGFLRMVKRAWRCKARDQSSRAYAEARLRLRSGKRWPRHAVTASILVIAISRTRHGTLP
jgi:hypothetical protein